MAGIFPVMNMVWRFLKPTPVTAGTFLLLVILQFAFFSSQTSTFSFDDLAAQQSAVRIGAGNPVAIIWEGGQRRVEVDWLVAALNFGVSYVLAALAAAAFVKTTQLRRPAIAFYAVAGGLAFLALLAALGLSRVMWGYWIERPPLLREAADITRVNAVMCVQTTNVFGTLTFIADASESLSDRIASAAKDAYYCLDERILVALDQRNLLPATPIEALPELPALYSLVTGSDLLKASDRGYDSAAGLRGTVVDAIDKSGDRLVLVGLTGGQVSNDHYPYYEMLLRERDGKLMFVRGQRFFYDVAGVEGFEWPAIWLMLGVPAIVLGLLLFTVVRGCSRCFKSLHSPPIPAQ